VPYLANGWRLIGDTSVEFQSVGDSLPNEMCALDARPTSNLTLTKISNFYQLLLFCLVVAISQNSAVNNEFEAKRRPIGALENNYIKVYFFIFFCERDAFKDR